MTDSGMAVPGLHFLSAPDASPSAWLARQGPFHVGAAGRLASRARRDGWRLLFDGVLTHGRRDDLSDAETALACFLEAAAGNEDDGFDALHALEGFYNVLLIDEQREQAHFFSDPLASRPWYLYQDGSTVAAAPTPLAFAEWELPMRLSRQELYNNFRFLHTSLGRTLVEEVTRLMPGTRYTLRERPPLRTHRYDSFPHRPDASITFDESVQRLKHFFSDVMQGLLTHPALRERPVHLPLTGGLDSRRILGELLEHDRPPAALRHVHHKTHDYTPVRKMADGLDLPLLMAPIAELDWSRLLHRWAARSAGLVNFHQSYLLEMIGRTPPGGAVGFNGYMMDLLMAVTPRKTLPDETTDPGLHVWEMHYTRRGMMALLLPDARALARQSREQIQAFAQRFDGPAWYQATLLDLHHRGMHYTGALDPMLADEALHFSPGAHARAMTFFQTVPREVAGDRRARLETMRRYFPDLAAYPDKHGRPYRQYDTLTKPHGGTWKYVRNWTAALLSGLQKDPAPETEHAWLRHIAPLQRMHRTAVHESALVRDGHLRRFGPRASWLLLHGGGYQAWTLMSLLSAEVAYRTLVRREPLRSVLARLNGNGDAR